MDELRVACANLEYGGGVGTDRVRWERSRDQLLAWEPHIILLQEVCAWPASRTRERAGEMAAELGDMEVVLGQPTPTTASRNRPAVLVRTSAGLAITGEAAEYPAGEHPAWAEAHVEIPGAGLHRVCSVHLPPWSAVTQRAYTERLVTMMTQPHKATFAGIIAGGDWNSYGRQGQEPDSELLAGLPEHLRPARLRRDGPAWAPNYDVYDTLLTVGLEDAALLAGPGRRSPEKLRPTGRYGWGRVDRTHVRGAVSAGGIWYDQVNTRGSDHEAHLVTFRPGERSAGRVM